MSFAQPSPPNDSPRPLMTASSITSRISGARAPHRSCSAHRKRRADQNLPKDDPLHEPLEVQPTRFMVPPLADAPVDRRQGDWLAWFCQPNECCFTVLVAKVVARSSSPRNLRDLSVPRSVMSGAS